VHVCLELVIVGERLEKLRDDFVGRVGLYSMERLWLYCYFCNS
jgi:hypothetical protein